MRRFAFGSPTPGQGAFERWAAQALREIELASAEDIEAVLGEFTVTGTITETRTFDAATATANDLRNVLATLINDIKKRGQKRAYAD